jgi:hypothetical protein
MDLLVDPACNALPLTCTTISVSALLWCTNLHNLVLSTIEVHGMHSKVKVEYLQERFGLRLGAII